MGFTFDQMGFTFDQMGFTFDVLEKPLKKSPGYDMYGKYDSEIQLILLLIF